MNNETASPAMFGPSTAIFGRTTSGNMESNELVNGGRDTTHNVQKSDNESGTVQSREPRHAVNPGSPIPTEGTTSAIVPYEVICNGGDIGNEAVPSITMFQGSSNFQISNTSINTIGGNAIIIRFGDGEFTELQRNLICDHIANLTVLPDIDNNLKRHVLTQSIISIPRAEAVFNDYQNRKKSGPCFEGTRVALLREMADWVTGPGESRMYVLSGLAGIGKSTVAYTIASRAAGLNLLGASFFFSRDEADRNNARRFFTTIAYQLCVYNESFAKVIGDVLLTERGSVATTKDPQEQLEVLILNPLRSIVQSRPRQILIVVDALDECDEEDEFSVLSGLSQLVRDLPSFKVILTTRPQPSIDPVLGSHGGHQIFYLQNIEDKVVDGDIRLYLQHNLSLEQVQRRYPKRQWCASDEQIDSLVRAAGRLFIIASTAVRYIFDKSASNPAAQMQALLRASAQDHTPFKDLDRFYTVILRNVVPANCDNQDMLSRYQSVVSAIIFVQLPLPVSTLALLIDIDVEELRGVLDNLQSVIVLGSDDVPRVFHKSFPDYLTDKTRCKDPHLRIDPRIRHTHITTRCFKIMDRYLKYNILGLGNPARFMSNGDGLKKNGITDEQLQQKIPQLLRYACVYWLNHFELANIEDADLMNGLETFADENLLYWLEVLSLIGKLDTAHRSIRVVLNLLNSTSSDLHQLLSDALRFISKFYEVIKRSALHTYYSGLPFTPTESLLYHRYLKDAAHNICGVEGGPKKWDAFVAYLSHEERVKVTKFSLDSGLLVSCSEKVDNNGIRTQGKLKIWDAATGTPISTILGHKFAVCSDFSTVASSKDNIITYYNVNGSARGTMFTASIIQHLALSSESSRVAAALSDGSTCLWDSINAKLIDSFDGFDQSEHRPQLQFSPTGTRLAYSSKKGITLRDGISGRFVVDLQFGFGCNFKFSGDGSRIAAVSLACGLQLWSTESGVLIGAVMHLVGYSHMAISANGSLLATAALDEVKLWSENRDRLAQIRVLELKSPKGIAFTLDNILAIATDNSTVELYNVKTHSFIFTLPFGGTPTTLAFSIDDARLAVGTTDGSVYLWDIRGFEASSPLSKEQITGVTAVGVSWDCSRLACGFDNGTVDLCGTSPTKRRIGPPASLCSEIMKAIFFRIYGQPHGGHTELIEFSPDGRLFASGLGDGTINLWNGGDGSLRGTLKAPGGLQAVALSNTVLVAGWSGCGGLGGLGGWNGWGGWSVCQTGVTLWSLDTLGPIHTFRESGITACKVSIAENSALIAVAFRSKGVTLLDVVNRTTIATFNVPYDMIHTMTFLPDNSQLMIQSSEGVFLSLDLINKHVIKGPTLEHLKQLPNIPLWCDVPICHCIGEGGQHYLAGLFSQHKNAVPVLWIPRDPPVTAWTQGSSTIALGCKNGRVILLRRPTNHVG